MPDAVIAYHALLGGSAGERLAAESQGALDEQLARRGLVFGERALCTVLRPRLYTPEHFRLLTTRVRPLMRAFSQAFRAAAADRALRDQFRLAEWEEALLDIDSGFDEPSPTSRLDLFVIDPITAPWRSPSTTPRFPPAPHTPTRSPTRSSTCR